MWSINSQDSKYFQRKEMVSTTPNKKLDVLRFQLIWWTLIKFPESENVVLLTFPYCHAHPDSGLPLLKKRRQVSQVLGSIWLTFFTYAVFMFAAENYTLIRPLTTKMTMENPAIWRCISSHKWQVSIAMLGTSGVIFLIFQVMVLWWIWLAQPMGLWFDLIRSTPWKNHRWKQRHGHEHLLGKDLVMALW